jgi:hypothetical protein
MNTRTKLLLKILLVAALVQANESMTSALDPNKCWNLCNEWVSCSTPCTVGNEEWTTCGQAQWPCLPD